MNKEASAYKQGWNNALDGAQRRAAAAVKSIVDDLRGRRGLRQEWDNIDDETREEIETSWERLIRAAIADHGGDG